MKLLLFKYLLTAALIVLIAEVAKRSDKAGALIGSLPLVTCMVLIWLYLENQSQTKIANHAWYTFWYVIPTLPMFLAFPMLLPRLGFWLTLLACVFISTGCFVIFAWILRRYGVELI